MDIKLIKKKNSDEKIAALRSEFLNSGELAAIEGLTVFATGSYARGEASEHSDIDLFFVHNGSLDQIDSPRIRTLRMFSKIVDISDQLKFPKFSNDGEFLKVLEKSKILESLGGRSDDYENHFTARMLMILESKWLYGQDTYESVLKDILSAYFKDYPDHPKDFQPTFLVNDILRFWKTLCLNYENKRNQPESDQDRIISQKIKNLKLKYSRMLTCFGSVCYIASLSPLVKTEDLFAMSKLSPMERLKKSADPFTNLKDSIHSAEVQYDWFLDLTNVSESELKRKFSNKSLRAEAFERADQFGDSVFTITKTVAENRGFLRYLLV